MKINNLKLKMNKIRTVFILSLFFATIFCNACTSNIRISSIITEENKPTAQFTKLLQLFGIDASISFEEIVYKTQQKWLRQKGKERWEIADNFQNKKSEVLPILESIGMIYEINPQKKHYDYVFMLGCSIHSTRIRINFLLKEWANGLRFENLIFLVSDRPLDKNFEKIEEPIKIQLKTEYEATKYIYNKMKPPINFEENFNVSFVSSECKQNKKRATTEDTIISWLDNNPKPGSCLFISSQPFVMYQDTVARSILPDMFSIETVGAESYTKNIGIQLDSTTRSLYCLHHSTLLNIK